MHVVYAIDNLGTGGAQRQAAELALHLTREFAIRVSVVTYRDVDFHGDRLREAGVPVILLPKAFQADPLFPWRLRRWLRAHRPDVVHAFLPMPCLWHFMAVRSLPARERPVFIAGERSAFGEFSLPHDSARRLVYPRSDAVTVNAEGMVRQVHERLGVPCERIHYLPNGIDLEAWDQGSHEASSLDFEPGVLHFALIGGLRRVKNHSLVLDALDLLGRERFSNWRVSFVGAELDEPDYAMAIRKRIQQAGLSDVVRMVPAVQNVAALLEQIDGLLMPSAFEGFPNVLLEAMASGVPAVASNVGDVANMIEPGETGFVLERTDAACLAQAMQMLAELGPERRAAIGARARLAVNKRYAMPIVARRYLDLYRELTSRVA